MQFLSELQDIRPRPRALVPTLICLVATMALSAVPASARQDPIRCGQAGGATIRGYVLAEQTNTPVAGHAVFLLGTGCATVTDRNGAFQISGVPIGAYRMGVDAIGDIAFDPIDVTVAADSLVMVRISVPVDEEIHACRADPSCGELLEPSPDPSLDITNALLETAWRTALTLAGARPEGMDWVACVKVARPVVRSALEARFQKVADSVDCGLGTFERDLLVRFVHRPTGQSARIFDVAILSNDLARATAVVEYSAGTLGSARWRCTFERADEAWLPRWCTPG